MTEDEARKKWCPLLGLAGATMASSDGNRNCIGSDCMMWRISHADHYVNGFKLQHSSIPYPQQAIVTIHHGYCGLAGKPTGD